MKFYSKFIFLFLLFSSFSLAKSYYHSCNSQVNSAENKVRQELSAEFDKTLKELEVLKTKYENNLERLKAENKLLDIKIALSKQKALKNKELVFLLKQYNEILSIELTRH